MVTNKQRGVSPLRARRTLAAGVRRNQAIRLAQVEHGSSLFEVGQAVALHDPTINASPFQRKPAMHRYKI